MGSEMCIRDRLSDRTHSGGAGSRCGVMGDKMTVTIDLQWCLGIVGVLATAVGVLAAVRAFLDRYDVTRREEGKGDKYHA